MAADNLRRVLLHGGSGEGFDVSVRFAGRLVETFGAELHVVYTVEEPLSAGWTAEIAADLAIVHRPDSHAQALLNHGHCSVLVLRK